MPIQNKSCNQVKPNFTYADCSGDTPPTVANANRDWDGTTVAIDTVITYTCTTSGGETFTSVCQGDGMWSDVTGTCSNTGSAG